MIMDGGMVITTGGARVVEGELLCEEVTDDGSEALGEALDKDPPMLATLLLRPDRSTVHALLPPPVASIVSITCDFQS